MSSDDEYDDALEGTSSKYDTPRAAPDVLEPEPEPEPEPLLRPTGVCGSVDKSLRETFCQGYRDNYEFTTDSAKLCYDEGCSQSDCCEKTHRLTPGFQSNEELYLKSGWEILNKNDGKKCYKNKYTQEIQEDDPMQDSGEIISAMETIGGASREISDMIRVNKPFLSTEEIIRKGDCVNYYTIKEDYLLKAKYEKGNGFRDVGRAISVAEAINKTIKSIEGKAGLKNKKSTKKKSKSKKKNKSKNIKKHKKSKHTRKRKKRH